MTKKTQFHHLEENLRLENQEIVVMRKRVRNHIIDKEELEIKKAPWEGKTGSIYETPSNAEQFFTWTVPTIKEAKFV